MYNKAIVSWIAAILWMATIFLLSHQPANDSSKLSLGVLDFFMQSLSAMMPQVEMHADLLHTVVRKGAHFGAYFILGILMLNGLRQVGGKGVKAAVLALCLCFCMRSPTKSTNCLFQDAAANLPMCLLTPLGRQQA